MTSFAAVVNNFLRAVENETANLKKEVQHNAKSICVLVEEFFAASGKSDFTRLPQLCEDSPESN